jgi:hypothetical protein
MNIVQNMTNLNVIVSKAPNKEEKVANQTAFFIREILKNLNYKGVWSIVLVRKTKKRSDTKFTVLRRQGTSILVRTKPGDNGTCWETLINPPRGYSLDLIFNDLRQVLNDGTLILTNAIKNIVVSTPVVSTPVVSTPVVSTPVVSTPVVSTPVVSTPVVSTPVVSTPVVSTPVVSTPNQFLIDQNTECILNCLDTLNKGFIILCMGMNKDGSIERQTAINLLVQEMNLLEFVKLTNNYNNPLKTSGIIIQGLNKKGLITRWSHPQRKKNRIRETTKGYLLTPLGKSKIEIIKFKLTEEVKNKLFTSVKPIEVKDKPIEVKDKPIEVKDKPIEVKDKPIEVKDKPIEVKDKPIEVKDKPIEVKPIEVKPIEVKDKPIEVKPIEVKPIEVKDAFEEYTNCKNYLGELNTIINEFQLNKIEIEKELKTIKETISKLEIKHKEIQNEIFEFKTMKEEEEENFKLIKLKIKNIIETDNL